MQQPIDAPRKPTCLHNYLHTYLHTYIHTYIPTYIPTHIHTYIPTYLHTYLPRKGHVGIRPPLRSIVTSVERLRPIACNTQKEKRAYKPYSSIYSNSRFFSPVILYAMFRLWVFEVVPHRGH